jgi:hypothetical protein
VIFPSNIIKTPESSRDGAYKKREGKRKALRLSSNKRGSQYFKRRKTLQLQKSFLSLVGETQMKGFIFQPPKTW